MKQPSSEVTLLKLRRLVASFPDQLPETLVLEQTIKIGAGFHNKWYRSQKEHWLGWLTLKSQQNKIDNTDFKPAKIWSGLKCSPMLFWMAEAAKADADTLEQLKKISIKVSKIKPQDGNPHGVEFRKVMPWIQMQSLLQKTPLPVTEKEAIRAGNEALVRLITHLPKYSAYLPE